MADRTRCCVVGGGPAGMMFAYLLARAGVEVTVLEKHADFFRDFRGDTVHPSTLEVFAELDLLDQLLEVPHQQITSAGIYFGNFAFTMADFSHLKTRCRFIALMPQWDFLDFLVKQARKFPQFRLEMEHKATALKWKDSRVVGVEVEAPQGAKTIDADLVVACDGRHSTMRWAAALNVIDSGVPIDVLWFRVSRKSNDAEQLLGRLNYGKALILINRGDYFQVAMIIKKGRFPQIQQEGLEKFRESIAQVVPFLADRVNEIGEWEQVKLLTVQINHLAQWHLPGFLCIGDAAHAMSPAGGVGINLAIQDAVAAARILAPALREGLSTDGLLLGVQSRREFPARFIQFLQRRAHIALARLFDSSGPLTPSPMFQIFMRVPGVQQVIGHVIGIGVRPEHIKERRGNHLIAFACGVGAGLASLRRQRRLAA